MGGKATDAACYPVELVEAILGGTRDTADADTQRQPPDLPKDFVCAITRAGNIQDIPSSSEAKIEGQGLADLIAHTRIPFKYADGRVVELDLKWKEAYRDEYTSDILPNDHIRTAMAEELEYLCREVIEGVPIEGAMADPNKALVGEGG